MFSDLKNETLKDKSAPGLFVPGSSHQFRTELEQFVVCVKIIFFQGRYQRKQFEVHRSLMNL